MLRAICVMIGGLMAAVGGGFTIKDGWKSFKSAKADGKKIDFND